MCGPVKDLRRLARLNYFCFVHEDHPIRHLSGKPHFVRHNQHGNARPGQVAHNIKLMLTADDDEVFHQAIELITTIAPQDQALAEALRVVFSPYLGEMCRLHSISHQKSMRRLFEDADLEFFKERCRSYPKLFSVLAYDEGSLVGFKIGYPYSEAVFYSWIGGVLPGHRKQGIGAHLAKIQEQWAVDQGYTVLRTKSMNRFKAMMALNLKNGFDITQVYTNSRGQTKIVFEKQLI